MKYSIYSWKDSLYHYFNGPGEEPGNRPKPRVKVNAPNGNGVQLEAVLPILPANATPAGKGKLPQGRIAITHDEAAPLNMFGMGGLTGTGRKNPFYKSPWLTLAAWAGGMLLATKLVHWTADYIGDRYYD